MTYARHDVVHRVVHRIRRAGDCNRYPGAGSCDGTSDLASVGSPGAAARGGKVDHPHVVYRIGHDRVSGDLLFGDRPDHSLQESTSGISAEMTKVLMTVSSSRRVEQAGRG